MGWSAWRRRHQYRSKMPLPPASINRTMKIMIFGWSMTARIARYNHYGKFSRARAEVYTPLHPTC